MIGENTAERSESEVDRDESLRLAALAKQGDMAAFETLVVAHERMVYNVIYRMMPNQEDVKDISQEVFLKAYRYLDPFDQKASFSTWIYKIAVNTAIDEMRRRKGKETISLDWEFEGEDGAQKKQYQPDGPSVEEQVLEKEGLQEIWQAMEKLSAEHRTVITLRDVEGLSYTEIAEITGTSLGTVKSRLARGRMALKDLLLAGRAYGANSQKQTERRGQRALR